MRRKENVRNLLIDLPETLLNKIGSHFDRPEHHIDRVEYSIDQLE
ncbi:MAG: hypothetical protein PVH61_02770 [Candidatus Aminicenantes bacterium]